jgi:hypothetical protein
MNTAFALLLKLASLSWNTMNARYDDWDCFIEVGTAPSPTPVCEHGPCYGDQCAVRFEYPGRGSNATKVLIDGVNRWEL